MERASIFTGVNEGYQGDGVTITDPATAVEIVNSNIKAVSESSQDHSKYLVYPGVVVYHTDWGCPKGGEVVAAIIADGSSRNILRTAAALRERLNQSTLSVGTYVDASGEKTRGFIVSVAQNLRAISETWQAKAADYNSTHGVYVSCGMYDTGKGTVVIQAEANPAFVKDTGQWENAVRDVANAVGEELGVPIKPKFRDAGFTYLKKPAQSAVNLNCQSRHLPFVESEKVSQN